MKFAKCPSCGGCQRFLKVCFVSSFGKRTCDHRETEYETIQSKVTPIFFTIIVPLIFGQHLPIFAFKSR